MIEAFKAIWFKPVTLALIGHGNGIIGEYQAFDFVLTLRQLFYQFGSRPALGLANTFDDYNRLGRIVKDARRAGLIDWDAIEDRVQLECAAKKITLDRGYARIDAFTPERERFFPVVGIVR
jgi:hypothetical protein